MQNTENRNTTHLNTLKQTLTQEDKIKVVNKENLEWKENYITIPSETRPEKR